jgi:predicted acyltransferase
MKAPNRLISLDVFRGMTIVLMILVNSPGNSFPYSWLAHSNWDGCTLADLVFPFFIIIVGISATLDLTKNTNHARLWMKITQRTVFIFFIGLGLNAFPNHFDWASIRVMGVLQRIAIGYFFSSILVMSVSLRTQALVMIWILIGYGTLMIKTGSLMPTNANIVGYIDRLILTPEHLWKPWFDPEGLMTTLPAMASVILGNLIGGLLLMPKTPKQKCVLMLFYGFVLLFLAKLCAFWLPINKNLWSSTYVLWSGGVGLLLFAVIYVFIEMKEWKSGFCPFALFGRHSLLIFILHVFFLKVQSMIQIHHLDEMIPFRVYITSLLFGRFNHENAALCYAISYTMLWFYFLCVFEKYRYHFQFNKSV